MIELKSDSVVDDGKEYISESSCTPCSFVMPAATHHPPYPEDDGGTPRTPPEKVASPYVAHRLPAT